MIDIVYKSVEDSQRTPSDKSDKLHPSDKSAASSEKFVVETKTQTNLSDATSPDKLTAPGSGQVELIPRPVRNRQRPAKYRDFETQFVRMIRRPRDRGDEPPTLSDARKCRSSSELDRVEIEAEMTEWEAKNILAGKARARVPPCVSMDKDGRLVQVTPFQRTGKFRRHFCDEQTLSSGAQKHKVSFDPNSEEIEPELSELDQEILSLADRLLRRNFEADRIERQHVTDINYIEQSEDKSATQSEVDSAVDKCEVNKFETSTMAHKNNRKSEAMLGTSTKVEDASTSTKKKKQFQSVEFISSGDSSSALRPEDSSSESASEVLVAKAVKQAVDRLGTSPTLSAEKFDSAEKIEVRADKVEVIAEPRIMRVRAK